ncbi:MAG: hypothetical protein H0T08_04845 [Acidobacteria bacterium]|nr:hypothetical protein [Acidobacteriota bacterium]
MSDVSIKDAQSATTNHFLLMIRSASYGFSEQMAASNAFQKCLKNLYPDGNSRNRSS